MKIITLKIEYDDKDIKEPWMEAHFIIEGGSISLKELALRVIQAMGIIEENWDMEGD